ncbi:MAG: hypothetical protein FJ276_18420, partial [Planctomycetes bacterium]|nr:hypothetical protein [Planctomycetota bacterium]
MKVMCFAATFCTWMSLAVCCPMARGGDPPKLLFLQDPSLRAPLPETAPVYVKQDSWQESMRASLQATFAPTDTHDQGSKTDGFTPAMVRLEADGQPRRLELRVAAFARLYVATLGRPLEAGSAWFLNPKLIDRQGHPTALEPNGPLVRRPADAEAIPSQELEVLGSTYRGFALPPGEICFQLDGKFDRLEVLVHYVPETGLPPYAAVSDEPVFARALECRAVRELLWDRVARDFRDARSQMEMEMERRDGIWNDYTSAAGEATDTYYRARAAERLELARKTLAFVECVAPRPEMAAELRTLEQQSREVAALGVSATGSDLFARAVDLRRRILFSHPALGFDRLLISKRPPPSLSAPGDNYYGIHNDTGPGLVVLDQWKTGRPRETMLLDGKLPAGCAMHADLSFDGQRVVFAYADHTPPRERWQFFLYEIGVDGSGLRQITGTNKDPLAGAGGRMTVLSEDYDPCYLPDGGLAFISTRNQGGVRCHNGDRYCPTYLLYRCDADGSNVRQLSFGEANEWDPVVMPDGLILWTRWDYINRPVIPTLGLWTIQPNG